MATFSDRAEIWHICRTHISKGSGTFGFSKSPKHQPYEFCKVGEKGVFSGPSYSTVSKNKELKSSPECRQFYGLHFSDTCQGLNRRVKHRKTEFSEKCRILRFSKNHRKLTKAYLKNLFPILVRLSAFYDLASKKMDLDKN